MRPPTFNFVPQRQLKVADNTPVTYRVSITSNYCLYFGKDVVDQEGIGGKYISFFADQEKKVLGWKIIEGDTTFLELNDAKEMKMNVNGAIIISIKKLLSLAGIKNDVPIKNIPVSVYKSAYLGDNKVYYIDLKAKKGDDTDVDN